MPVSLSVGTTWCTDLRLPFLELIFVVQGSAVCAACVLGPAGDNPVPTVPFIDRGCPLMSLAMNSSDTPSTTANFLRQSRELADLRPSRVLRPFLALAIDFSTVGSVPHADASCVAARSEVLYDMSQQQGKLTWLWLTLPWSSFDGLFGPAASPNLHLNYKWGN